MLSECQRLRKKAEAMGLPTDLTGEHFCMRRSAGIDDLQAFKRETLLDILSGDYAYTDECFRKVNLASERLARRNVRRLLVPERKEPGPVRRVGGGVEAVAAVGSN
jgi:hypothetical protein